MAAKRHKAEDYSFICAYMASRDKYLLTSDKIDKMLDSKTADDAARILLEMNYLDESENVSASDFETILSRELKKTYSLILPFVPEQGYFELFLYPNDYHNMKTLLKAEFLGIKADEFLIDAGTIPSDTLEDMLRGRAFEKMRPEMAKGIQEALEEYNVSHDPQTIDFILDKACYKDMNDLVSGLDSDFIKRYLALKIDIINLVTFIRIREMGKPVSLFLKVFIENGNIPADVFEGGFEEETEQFAERLESYGLQAVLSESAQMIRESGRVTMLEKLCDNYLMSYIAEAKYICYGLEPLIANVAAKENEIKTVRIILAGKLAGISTEQIRERVRETYA